jgi:hypothetical protein
MKKLLAILLAAALIFALALPAFAKDATGPSFLERSLSKLQCIWDEIKAAIRGVLIWLGIIDSGADEPFDPDDPPIDYKPVIYLYPEQPMEVSVTLEPRGAHFIETIPDYGAGWRVLAQPGGTLTNLADGKEYPYLFWEAAHDAPWPKLTKGFIVARDDLAGFLNEKLAYLGLNDAEAGEFIEFWLPKLLPNEYTLLHFAGKEYGERFPLQVSPTPDSLLRVFMVARAAAGSERISPQELVPFERKGFAMVEWGGTIL